jgi:hypothetical protein
VVEVGKRLILSVDNLARTVLDREQADAFTRFLAEGRLAAPAERPDLPPLRLRDHDDNVGRQLDACWSRSGQRLVLTVRPALDGREGARAVELRIDAVEALETLTASSPHS